MIKPPKVTQPPEIKRVSVMNWLKGYSSSLDDGRVENEGLTAAQNVLLDQDGVIKPWPSLITYGPAPSGTILGEVGVFKEISGTTKTIWLITVQNVSGTAHVWIRKDKDAWIECTGKDFNTTASCRFAQIDDKVLITNGVDNLAYLDIVPTSGTYHDVIPFVALTVPAGLSATPTGLTGTTYTLKYKVTASNQGETTGQVTAATITVSKLRGSWNGSSEYVDISWNRVTNATQYHIYCADTAGGKENYLGTVTDPGTGATATYRDYGNIGLDYTRSVPLSDTSAGPIAKRADIVNGKVFLTGQSSNMREIRFGGDSGYELDFGPYNGGGGIEVGGGSKEVPVRVLPFRDGRGTPTVTVLCQSTAGRGKRYVMTPTTLNIGDTVISTFKVEEDNGEDGTDAADSALVYKDAVWYLSLDGFKTTYTKEQIQNILSTDEVSQRIENDIANISLQNIDKAVGCAYKGRLYWSVPVGNSENNQIWTLDLKRGRGWMLPRYCNADWLVVYEDNSGSTHFLALVDNVLKEFSYSSLTNDDGEPFGTYARSGLIKFSKDGMDWAAVIDVTFVFLRPKGSIQIQVDGFTEDDEISQSIGSGTYTAAASFAGWGESDFTAPLNWGETLTIPTGSNVTRKTKTIEIDEELAWLTWSIKTTEAGVDYSLSDVIISYIPTGWKDLSD